MSNHRINCEAAICASEITEEEMETLVWFPGEKVCSLSPRTKWQIQQARINQFVNKGKFKNPGLYFTAFMLDNMKQMARPTAKGIDPDKFVECSDII